MSESRPQALWFEGFVIDLVRGCLRRDSADVKLRPKSFAVLRFLAENHGRLLSKEEIIKAVWNDAFVTDNSLVQCLIEIRRVLGDDSQTIIRTVTRRGYIFDVAVTGGDELERSVGSSRRQANSAAEAVAATRVELFGGFRISCKGAQVTAVNTSRMQALLAYLLLNAGSTVSRQELAFLFWPDSSDPQARTNLRQLLHHFRSAWPAVEDYIESDARTVRWRTEDSFTFDVSEFETTLARADEAQQREDSSTERRALLGCLDLYRGDLLPGLHDEWIGTHRERLKDRDSGGLGRLIALFEQARDYPAAIRHAESLLSQDPFQETVYQAIMRLHGLNGGRAEGPRPYERCATVLHRELGGEPGIATRRIRHQTSTAGMQPHSGSEVRARNSEPVLVGREPEWMRLL